MLPILGWIFNCLYFSSLAVCCFLFSSFDSFKIVVPLCCVWKAMAVTMCSAHHMTNCCCRPILVSCRDHNHNYCFPSRQSKSQGRIQRHPTYYWYRYDCRSVDHFRIRIHAIKNKNLILFFQLNRVSARMEDLKERAGKTEKARARKTVDLESQRNDSEGINKELTWTLEFYFLRRKIKQSALKTARRNEPHFYVYIADYFSCNVFCCCCLGSSFDTDLEVCCIIIISEFLVYLFLPNELRCVDDVLSKDFDCFFVTICALCRLSCHLCCSLHLSFLASILHQPSSVVSCLWSFSSLFFPIRSFVISSLHFVRIYKLHNSCSVFFLVSDFKPL